VSLTGCDIATVDVDEDGSRRGRDSLLLDEPWSGLDPVGAAELTARLRWQSSRGTAILFTAHDLFRARAIATRIDILAGGRLVAEVATAGLTDAELERLYLHVVTP
jgi:ABC-2 type transport system ATP-binding protein